MNRSHKAFAHGLASFLLTILPHAHVQADDIEIFFGRPDIDSFQPNILFLMDNSGSMSSAVETTTEFDISEDYTGSFDKDYIYFTYRNTYLQRWTSFGSFPATSNVCRRMSERLADGGAYANARAGWQSIRRGKTIWKDLSVGTNYSAKVECYDDRGQHGETDSASETYAQDGYAAGWGTLESREIDWSEIDRRDFYSGNYLNWYYNHRVLSSTTRIEVIKSVTTRLANRLSGVNVGLASFNQNGFGGSGAGGSINVAIEDIETNRATLLSKVSELYASGNTPVAETLYEVYRYLSGGNILQGFTGDDLLRTNNRTDPNALTSPDSTTYKSPIDHMCQTTSVVVLTDGAPVSDNDKDSTIASTIGNSCSGNCLDEIAKYMFDNDVGPPLETQNVRTYTIGFALPQDDFLKQASEGDGTDTNRGGGGKHYVASNADDLEAALMNITGEILSFNTAFVSPGVAVNSFNKLNHRDALFFSVFKPKQDPQWPGNLKRYKLKASGEIVDIANNPAVDETSGFFRDNTKSWWSTLSDGADVTKGGTRDQLDGSPATRNVFTFISSINNKNLNQMDNQISVANKANISKTTLGDASMTDEQHEELLNWVRGYDTQDADGDLLTNDSRQFIADPLHSVPNLVLYGGTEGSPDLTVFFGDNQGFIHAINSETGQMYFSFMPEELLVNQLTIYNNDLADSHPYGMDGTITAWLNDSDNNVSRSDGDFVYIYAGMRRGGRNYYALDTTSRTAPKFLWSIKGGETRGFEELGQTWSKPIKTKVKVGNRVKDVLIFSGGYDPQQDNVTIRTEDTVGRALYIVDAVDGSLIWSGGPSGSDFTKEFSEMRYSIPATPTVWDSGGDGLADQIYVGDMGGQIWRFDIHNSKSNARDLVTGAVIAKLSGANESNNRRFYHSPDIFGIKHGGTPMVGLSIGSGWHAHPLNRTITDRLYYLRLESGTLAPEDTNNDGVPDYVTLTESDLYDTSNNLIVEGATSEIRAEHQSLMYAAKGWYITMPHSGEKILASTTTINGETYYTTYEPNPNRSSCQPSTGTPRLYHINAQTGEAIKNYDGITRSNDLGQEILTKEDREVQAICDATGSCTDDGGLKTGSLPPPPKRLRIDGKDIICVGSECRTIDSSESFLKTYWYEE